MSLFELKDEKEEVWGTFWNGDAIFCCEHSESAMTSELKVLLR